MQVAATRGIPLHVVRISWRACPVYSRSLHITWPLRKFVVIDVRSPGRGMMSMGKSGAAPRCRFRRGSTVPLLMIPGVVDSWSGRWPNRLPRHKIA